MRRTPINTRTARGQWAEQLAQKHLEARGLKVLERNYRCPRGEIDLVLREGKTLIFVEVRYRARSEFGTAAESVDPRKRARILRCAQHYLQSHANARDAVCRFDVVLVQGVADTPGIEWIPNAFEA